MKQLTARLACVALVASLDGHAQVPEGGSTSRELGIRVEPPSSTAELIARGEAVFDYWCRACHGPEMLKPGTAALAIKYDAALPAALAERTDMTPEFVSFYVRQGISMMPFFRPTEISDADLEALAAFLTRSPRRRGPGAE